MKKRQIIYFLMFVLIVNYQFSNAQIHDFDSLYKNDKVFKKNFKAASNSKGLFDSEEVMKITIESDFKNLVKRKYEDEEQPALLRYFYKDSIVVNRNITIKPRGNMRKGSCFFPPLKLNFLKSEVVVKEMKEFDKMKMVLNCKRGGIYEQYLVSEYYTYKILNILTGYSFRVRLTQVTYIDTGDKYKTTTKYAFLIENKPDWSEKVYLKMREIMKFEIPVLIFSIITSSLPPMNRDFRFTPTGLKASLLPPINRYSCLRALTHRQVRFRSNKLYIKYLSPFVFFLYPFSFNRG